MKVINLLAVLLVIAVLFLAGCLPKVNTGCDLDQCPAPLEDTKLTGGAAAGVEDIIAEDTSNVKEDTDEAELEDVQEIEVDEDTPVKEYTEGDLVGFPNLKATDPDGDKITYTFTEPLDGEGKWQT